MKDLMELCTDQLQNDEGLRLHVYKDSLGNDTIGYGHLLKNGISERIATEILKDDLSNVILECMSKIGFFNEIDLARQTILVNMVFNMGIDGVLSFKKMLTFMQLKQYILAANELKSSTAYKQEPERIKRLANIMETGKIGL